jgi:hypothetical protein
MKHDVDTALDQCLHWMRNGEQIEDCIARYPEYAEELRPLLGLATDVGRVLTPASSAAARAAGQQRMLATLGRQQQQSAGVPLVVRHLRRVIGSLVPGRPGSLRPIWQAAVVALVALLVVGSGVAYAASEGSLPGDLLYPVKLAGHSLQLALTLDPEKQELLEEQFSIERRQDIQAVLASGRQASVEFEGILEEMEADLWFISGLAVTVQDSTVIEGQPYLGALLGVQGDLSGNGLLLANRISVQMALEPRPTETPEPTVTPRPAQTPVPTATSAPSVTPDPTDTPRPTETAILAEPTETLEPSATPEPTWTPVPTERPEGTESVEPTEASEPTEEPRETDAPPPTGEPEPPEETDTPEPPGGPEPTEDPEETETP